MSHKASSDVPDDGKDADEEVEKKRKSVKEWFLGAVRGFGFLSPCDPSKRFHRYQMLVFMCLLSFGSYFVYDNPAALQRDMINVFGVDYSTFMLQYSLYSWPNVVLSMLGGYLIDKVFGIRVGTVVFSALVCLGQVVYALGAQFNQFYVMLTGRFIFGLGGENLAVAQNAYIVLWFKGAELNMVFGLLLSVSRIGSTVNMNTLHTVFVALGGLVPYGYQKIAICLWIGFVTCLLSLLAGVVLGLFDLRAEKLLKRKEGKVGEVIRLKDILRFPLSLWLVFAICVLYYVTVFPFIGLAMVFFEQKWLFTSAAASAANSLVYIVSAVASPFLGLMVDFVGYNVHWVNVGTILTLASHALFAFTAVTPYFLAILMGLSYSLLACGLWPLVAYIVPEHQLGTAYGFMQAIQNLGLAVVAIVAGKIVDVKGYLVYEVFNCALLCLALMTGMILYVLDSSRGWNINISAKQRRKLNEEYEKKKEAEEEGEGEGEGGEDSEEEKTPIISSGEYKVKPAPYVSHIHPRSSDQIRMRYLARTGARMYQPGLAHSGSLAHLGVLK